MRGTRLNCWKIIAHWPCQARLAAPFSASTLVPSNRISPEVASVRRFIIRSNVDFPAPDRPMMPTKAGRSRVKLTRSTAVFGPNRRVTDSACSSIAPLLLLGPRYAGRVTGVIQFREGFSTGPAAGSAGNRSGRGKPAGRKPGQRRHHARRGQAQRQAADLVAEAGQQRADQPARGIGHVVEADIAGDPVGRSEGEDQVGMDRGVDREDKAEQQQPRDQRRGQPGRGPARQPRPPAASAKGIGTSRPGPEDRLAR